MAQPVAGDRFLRCGQEGRVMAVAENYVMLRLKGCVPFVFSMKEFAQQCCLIEKAEKSRG